VLAQELLAKRHSIDAGVMQINSSNWARFGLRPETIFDLQANVCAGVSIIAEDYAAERKVPCRYNTGKPDCANDYPDRIERIAARLLVPKLTERRPETQRAPAAVSQPQPAFWDLYAQALVGKGPDLYAKLHQQPARTD
jgi:type IV secretion system protein VirB1